MYLCETLVTHVLLVIKTKTIVAQVPLRLAIGMGELVVNAIIEEIRQGRRKRDACFHYLDTYISCLERDLMLR